MLRAAIGDIHLSGFQSDKLDKQNLPERLGIIIRTLDFIINKCRERKIVNVDILGDIINDKSIIYSIAQDAFKDFLVRNKDINFILISGNHDLSSTGDLQKSAISVFSEYSNVHCIEYEPEVIKNITYIPFSDNFLELIKTIQKNDILISHLGLNEAHLQSGLSKIDKISIKDLRNFKLVLLGHYHAPQSIENIYYAGSIFAKDWNDKNENKRILVYNTDTLEVESIPITGFPEYKEYTITTIDQKDEILKNAEIDKNKGHRVRIRNKTSEKIKEDVSGGVLVIESQEIDITNRGIQVTQTREEQLKKYLQIKQIPENEHKEYLNILTKFDLLRKDS
jgi:DNA repair exonuclease SbcCD nuclease subunit